MHSSEKRHLCPKNRQTQRSNAITFTELPWNLRGTSVETPWNLRRGAGEPPWNLRGTSVGLRG
eukprot:1939419-Lingulodinium_polyedra.AAC.1